MGPAESDIDQGGSLCTDIRIDLLGGSSIVNAVRVRDMGSEAAYKEGVGQIPPQGVPQADMEATAEDEG